ncbi:Uncharacterised protein [Vibrio cholerae]|nr:Uncharacterised protein [Vibrio cholerae]CSI64625.1 Uncharacterised protein [Vibrio cholerae]
MFEAVIKENSMDRFTHIVVAAEREGNVRNTARNHRMRQLTLNVRHCINEIQCVVIVLINSGRNSKDVRVKNNIFRWEAHLIDQNMVSPTTDL